MDAIAERLMAMDERQSKMLQVIGAATGDASVVSEEDEGTHCASCMYTLRAA